MAWTLRSQDTFTDTPATALASHTPDVGSVWVVDVGIWLIAASGTDVRQSDVTANPAIARNTTTLGDTQAVEITLDNAETAFAIAARWTTASGGNGYFVYLPGGDVGIYRFDAGVPTLLNTYAVSTGAGDVIRLECSGSNITTLKNGGSLGTEVDATYTSGVGIMAAYGQTLAGTFTTYAAYDDAGAAYDGSTFPYYRLERPAHYSKITMVDSGPTPGRGI